MAELLPVNMEQINSEYINNKDLIITVAQLQAELRPVHMLNESFFHH